jgi:hypothetical protein
VFYVERIVHSSLSFIALHGVYILLVNQRGEEKKLPPLFMIEDLTNLILMNVMSRLDSLSSHYYSLV